MSEGGFLGFMSEFGGEESLGGIYVLRGVSCATVAKSMSTLESHLNCWPD